MSLFRKLDAPPTESRVFPLLLTVAVFAVFVPLVWWSFYDGLQKQESAESAPPWPLAATLRDYPRQFYGTLWERFEAKRLSDAYEESAFNYWYQPSFSTSVFVSLEVKEQGTGWVTVRKASPYSLGPSGGTGKVVSEDRFILDKAETAALLQILESIRFWATPPGEQLQCHDGTRHTVEAVRNEGYRFWSTGCYATGGMVDIAQAFLDLADERFDESL